MSNQKTINLEMHWAEIATGPAHDVLTVGGLTPGGKSVRVRITLHGRATLGYLGADMHRALKKREEELKAVRQQLEGRG